MFYKSTIYVFSYNIYVKQKNVRESVLRLGSQSSICLPCYKYSMNLTNDNISLCWLYFLQNNLFFYVFEATTRRTHKFIQNIIERTLT